MEFNMEDILRELNSALLEAKYLASKFISDSEGRLKDLNSAKTRLKKECNNLFSEYVTELEEGDPKIADEKENLLNEKEEILLSVEREISDIEDIVEDLESLDLKKYVFSKFDKEVNDRAIRGD